MARNSNWWLTLAAEARRSQLALWDAEAERMGMIKRNRALTMADRPDGVTRAVWSVVIVLCSDPSLFMLHQPQLLDKVNERLEVKASLRTLQRALAYLQKM